MQLAPAPGSRPHGSPAPAKWGPRPMGFPGRRGQGGHDRTGDGPASGTPTQRRGATTVSLDASSTRPHPEQHPTADESRRRLEHARRTSLTQLQTLTDDGHTDEQLTSAQKTAVEQTLKEIDAAFARIADGTYGTCQTCHTPVPEERLEILPYTRYCVGCRRRTAT